jgi:predicted nucleic acid-binding protein
MGSSAVTTIDDALANVTRLGLDTAPVIYFVEAFPRHDALVTNVFSRVAEAQLVAVTSVITLAEVLVQPVQRGQRELQAAYTRLLRHSANFELLPVDIAVAEHAAELRARYRLRMPDALQVATALAGGCQAFLTNDHALTRVTDLRVLVLDDLTA